MLSVQCLSESLLLIATAAHLRSGPQGRAADAVQKVDFSFLPGQFTNSEAACISGEGPVCYARRKVTLQNSGSTHDDVYEHDDIDGASGVHAAACDLMFVFVVNGQWWSEFANLSGASVRELK